MAESDDKKFDEHTVISTSSKLEEENEHTPATQDIKPPYVVVVDGPHVGVKFKLSQGENVIGRLQECQIKLDDQSISRQHSVITLSEDSIMLSDMKSKNATYLNGKKVIDPVEINHKDCIKVGIYLLRLILKHISKEEELAVSASLTTSDKTVFMSVPHDAKTQEIRRDENIPEDIEENLQEEHLPEDKGEYFEAIPEAKKSRIRIPFLIAIIALVTISGFFGYRFFKKTFMTKDSKIAEPKIIEKKESALPAVVQKPVAPSKIPVFLDFASSPLPANVSIEGEEIGTTPVRINLELEPNKTYKAHGLFKMLEMREDFKQEIEFTVEADKSIIPIFFRAPIGILKINEIPPDVSFDLEGIFEYRLDQKNPAKLEEIVLQKPIYIPFGKYILELRRARRLGETSPTVVQDIIFRRDFELNTDNPIFTLKVTESDLKIFPAQIKTAPTNANIFIDGKPVGVSPYNGFLPLGEHILTVRKDGYFEHTEKLDVSINMPYLATIELKTSLAGTYLNNARTSMNQSQYQTAINELAEALNNNPTDNEKSQAYLMLGQCYLQLRDFDRSSSYFEQAKSSQDTRLRAVLGLVSVHEVKKETAKALPLLVEVMLQAKDDDIKKEANALFQKVSPFRSVVYIHTEPSGATVFVNDKIIGQKTPLILHQLHLGGYRIRIEKEGYIPTDLNLSLSVNEFNPVMVKLKPIPE